MINTPLKMLPVKLFGLIMFAVWVLSACTLAPEPAVTEPPPVSLPPSPPKEPLPPAEPAPVMQKVDWTDVEGWLVDDPVQALGALQQSCISLRWRDGWQDICTAVSTMRHVSSDAVRAFLESSLQPYQMLQEDGNPEGLVTGYYVPDLRGSRIQSDHYAYPIYKRPADLLTVDLKGVYPNLANYRLRGRLNGNRVVPYWDRQTIDGPETPLAGEELFWVDDPVELFFLHVQGSGRILLEDGRTALVNYADQNGHPYRSIGRWMIDRGIMTRDQMSMQNIRAWARDNPDQTAELLAQNPSYVFFRELATDEGVPPGALGVPLTPGRSLAVDPRHVPLGVPVFLVTTWPGTDLPLRRLMLAQDTGGAIKGRVRADFFWGMGAEAGEQAGRMKQEARIWVLLPR